jgi:hypothetical protein
LGSAKDSTAFDINSPEWNDTHGVTITNIDADSLGGHGSAYFMPSGSIVQAVNGSSGSIVFTAGSNITLSQSQSTITIIGPASVTQSVQTQNSIQLNGSSGSVVLTAGNNITLSQSQSTITISAANQSVQTQNIVQINGSSGSIVFTAGNNITLSQSQSTITVSAAAQTVQTQNMVTINGSTGSIVFTAGNNITLSQSASTITISAPNLPSSFVQQLDGSSGSVTISASANITVSNTGGTILLSVGNYLTNAMGTDAGSRWIAASAGTTCNNASITLASNGVQLSVHAIQTGISGIAGSNASTATSGTVQFANSNGLTFGLSGNTITGSHNGLTVQSAQTGISGIAGSNASTATSGTVQFANSNGLTFGLSGNTITGSVHAQQTGVSGIAGSNASTATSGTVQFANSNGLTFGLSGNTITASHNGITVNAIGGAGISGGNTSNTSGTYTGSLLFAGSNNITLSAATGVNGQSITISGPTMVALSAPSASASNGTINFSNSNNVSWSMNGSTIVASASFASTTIQSYNGGIAASGGTVTAGTAMFSNSNNVTFGMNGSTITASASGYARNWGSSGASTSWVSSAGTATNQAKLLGQITITPVNSNNSIYLDAVAVMQITTTGGHTFNWWRSNSAGQTVVGFPLLYTPSAASTLPLRWMQVDAPGVSSALTYNLYHNGANSKTVQVSGLLLLAEEM